MDFPQRELFALTQQMRKSAVSAVANIVEGAARETEPDFRRFLSISQGSLHELGYYIRLANRLKYLSPTEARSLRALQTEAAKVVAGLIRALAKPRKLKTKD